MTNQRPLSRGTIRILAQREADAREREEKLARDKERWHEKWNKKDKNKSKPPGYYGKLQTRAEKFSEKLKKRATPAERKMAEIMKRIKSKNTDLDYDFQRVWYNPDNTKLFFILDYLVKFPRRYAIEIDGGYHVDQIEKDRWRDEILLREKLKTIRFTNGDILDNSKEVESELVKLFFG